MILVTGATGNLGSSVIEQLQKNISKEQFIATSSSDSGVDKLNKKGFKARIANFDNINTLNEAFKGIDKLLLISTMAQNRFEQHKNVIDAAKNQGVKHIIYTSLAIKDINTSGVKDLMISHFETEDYIKSSGLTYTILRNTMYADALGQILGENALNQDINLPAGDGKVPFVLRREMGEGIANLLIQDGHEDKVYAITGSKQFGLNEIAEVLTEISNSKINYNNISSADFNAFLESIGFPEFAIYLHSGTIVDIKSTQYEITDTTLEKLLGRPTASIKDFLKEVFNIK